MRYYSSIVMQNILNNERFVNYVDVTLIDGTVINLEPSDLLEGCSVSDRIDCLTNLIGNTIGKSCTILISNRNGSYTNTDFLGASMKVYTATRIVGVVPFLFKSELGKFSITSVNVDDDAITLTGVDNMIKLDVPYVPTVTLPCTIADIYEDICTQCDFMSISLGSMGELEISNIPSNCTCRSMIIWICEVLGANAKVSEGYLNISQFFSLPTGVSVTPYNVTISHASTIVSGIEIINTSGIITTYGSEGFLVRIKNNPLVNEHEQEVGQFLYNILKDFEFVAFSGEFPPDPRFESLDVINVTDKDGTLHQTILTGVTYDVSDKMTLECNVSDEPTNNATYEDVETVISEFETQSKIEQSSSEILLQVSSTYTPKSNAIQSDTLHYLATDQSSGVTTSTSGWTTTPQSVTSVNKYLWTYHTYTYADSTQASPHTADTTPVITGVYGDRGQQGESGTYVWNLLPAIDDVKIKWETKVRIKSYSYDYSNGTYTLVTGIPASGAFQNVYTYWMPMNADMLAMRGKTCTFHIDDITTSYSGGNPRVYLQISINGTDTTGGVSIWIDIANGKNTVRTFTMPATASHWRLFLRADQTTNRTPADTTVVFKGIKLEAGSVATEWSPNPADLSALDVLEVKPLYYLNTSNATPSAPTSEVTSTSTSAGTWTTVMPTLTATARYVFTCDQTKYTGDNFTWSTPVLNQYLTDLDSRMTTAESKITDSAIVNTVASNMKNCGRNLLHGTSGAPRAATYPGSSGYNNIAEYYTSIIPTSNSYVLSFEAKSTVAGDKITNYFYDPGTTTSAVSSQGYVSTATDGATKITLTTSWVRYWIKFTQTAASTRKRVLVGRCMYGNGTGTVSIRKVQLEEGTVPTDWSVAPDEGINLTLDTLSINSPTSYLCARIPLTKNLEAGKTYTLQLWDCVLDSGSSGLRAYWGGGSIALTGSMKPNVNGYASAVFSVTDANASGNGAYNLWLDMYNFTSGHSGSNCTIGKWKLEEGGAATPWSPAPVQIASMTKVEQLSDKISMVVANDSTSSSVVLTPNALTAIANNIDLSGKVTFNSLAASAFQSLSAYGTCSTAAGTAAKVVNDIPNFSLSTMSRAIVFFVNENTASSPTLNVNGTGAATIYTPTSTGIKAISSSNGNTRYNWPKYSTIEFVKYDGGWLMVNGASEAVMNNIYSTGTTTIDGGKITANSVTAREIDVTDVFAQNVTATGTITGATIKGASGEFTEKFFTDVVLQDTVGNEINGKMYFDPSNKLFKVLIASPEYGDDPQAPFYGTMEFSNQDMSIGHAHGVSIFSQDGEISLSAPMGGISLSPSVSCNQFHANNQFSISSGGKFIINNANGSGNSKILTSTSSGMAFNSLYDLAVTEGNGTFTNKTISSGKWTKIGGFTIPKGKYLIITQADISTASGGTYTNGVVGLGINTGTSTKSSYTRFDSKVNCNAGSVYLQNVRVVSSSSSTDINVWVHSTMANAISVDAGFMYLGLPG